MFKKIISLFLLIVISVSINSGNFCIKNYSNNQCVYKKYSNKIALNSMFQQKVLDIEVIDENSLFELIVRVTKVANIIEKYFRKIKYGRELINIQELIDYDSLFEECNMELERIFPINVHTYDDEFVYAINEMVELIVYNMLIKYNKSDKFFETLFNQLPKKLFCKYIAPLISSRDVQYKFAKILALSYQEHLGLGIGYFDKLSIDQRYELAYMAGKINGYLVLKYISNFGIEQHPKFKDLLFLCSEFGVNQVRQEYNDTINSAMHDEQGISDLFEKTFMRSLPINILAKMFIISYKNSKLSYDYLFSIEYVNKESEKKQFEKLKSKYYSFLFSLFCNCENTFKLSLLFNTNINTDSKKIIIDFVKKITGKKELSDIKLDEYNYAGVVVLLFEIYTEEKNNNIELSKNEIENKIRQFMESKTFSVLRKRVFHKPHRLRCGIAELLIKEYFSNSNDCIEKEYKNIDISQTKFNKIVLSLLFDLRHQSEERKIEFSKFINNIFHIKDNIYINPILNNLFFLIGSQDINDDDKFNIIKKINALIDSNIENVKSRQTRREKAKLVLETLRFVNVLIKLDRLNLLKTLDLSKKQDVLEQLFFEKFGNDEDESNVNNNNLKKIRSEKFIKSPFNDPDVLRSLLTYYTTLESDPKLIKLLKIFVSDVLNGTFEKNRIDRSIHLQEIFKNRPDLRDKFRKNMKFKFDKNNTDTAIQKFIKSWDIEEGTVEITDDPIKIFSCSNDVRNSCLRDNDWIGYSQYLLGYLLDGKIKLMTLTDKSGNVIARCVIKLLIDKKTKIPVLFVEKLYHKDNNCYQDLANIFIYFVRNFAKHLKVSLIICDAISNYCNSSEYLFNPFYDGICSLSNFARLECSDSIGKYDKTEGTYVLTNVQKMIVAHMPFSELVRMIVNKLKNLYQIDYPIVEILTPEKFNHRIDEYIDKFADPLCKDALLAIKCAS
jgi:hypothetical protein